MLVYIYYKVDCRRCETRSKHTKGQQTNDYETIVPILSVAWKWGLSQNIADVSYCPIK